MKYILVKEVIGPIITVLVSVLIYNIITGILKKLIYSDLNKIDDKRKKTIYGLIRNMFRVLIIIIVILTLLNIYGINTNGLIASISVIGVVIGLAFQDLLKDFVAGVSIVIEGQYLVGDTVTINGFKGEVIALGLRSTRIKSFTGETMIIDNHLITEVINYNLSDSLALVDIDIAYESNIEKVEKVLNKLCVRLTKELPYLKGNVELLGINSLESSSIKFRITVLTEAMKQYEVQRIMLREIKLELDKNDIVIPYNQVVVHNG